MNFQSFGFLAFLLVTATLCLTIARRDRRIAVGGLTLACLLFYIGGGGWAAFLVLAAGLAVSAIAVRRLTTMRIRVLAGGDGPYAYADPRTPGQRRLCLALAAVWHIGVLAVFKYTGFFTGGGGSPGWGPLGPRLFSLPPPRVFSKRPPQRGPQRGGRRVGVRALLPLRFPAAEGADGLA